MIFPEPTLAFSKVYRGEILNTEVTVKKFGENNESGFLSEILAISRTNHPNIMKMIGYCIHETTRMLVLEFIPNNTLDFHLYGGKMPSINWQNRMKIALGVAKGLAYLHEDCDPMIMHRNIKSSNVLLDFNFEPKIAGFDFAINVKRSISHTETQSSGTGYMFPDYNLDNKHFDKSDVFSFGLVLLGLVTGSKPSSYVGEVRRVVPLLKKVLVKKKYEAIADPELGKRYGEEEMSRMILCAASCIYKPEKSRPKMKQIIEALEGDMSMELIWQHKKDWHYLRPLEVDRPTEEIWDED
ncbi:Protein kinase superfamily protein [Euphorbia peplus]|nr:Protein kinase superfamily protein [Euphorbia peplus]